VNLEVDPDKADEAALALLYLTLHDGRFAWKGFDWEVINRLFQKGLIGDPVNRTKSVVFSDEGLQAAEQACRKLLCRNH